MGDVGVRVLGSVEVVGEAGPIRLAAMQTRLLAALLIGAGSARSIDELVEAVWDGGAPQSARKARPGLRLSAAQGAPSGSRNPDRRRWVRGAACFGHARRRAVRAVASRNAARRATQATPALAASLVEQALGLWQGRAYGELAYEDFARGESERLEELRLDAIEERLAAMLELGRAAEVLGEVLGHAEANALRERSHELAMLALYRVGRQADALEHYAVVPHAARRRARTRAWIGASGAAAPHPPTGSWPRRRDDGGTCSARVSGVAERTRRPRPRARRAALASRSPRDATHRPHRSRGQRQDEARARGRATECAGRTPMASCSSSLRRCAIRARHPDDRRGARGRCRSRRGSARSRHRRGRWARAPAPRRQRRARA